MHQKVAFFFWSLWVEKEENKKNNYIVLRKSQGVGIENNGPNSLTHINTEKFIPVF